MDFVVAGILIGAFFVGIGLVVRDLGPRKRPRIARDESREIAAETLARAWRRFCQSAGSLVMTLGLLILLATVLAMVVGLGDGAGLITVSATTAISLLVILFAGLTMPNHYRQGKFDPIMRSWRPVPRPAIERDVEYALPVAPSAHGEDPFYSPSRSTPARPVETFFPDASETDPGAMPLTSPLPRPPYRRDPVETGDELPAWGAPPQPEPPDRAQPSSRRTRPAVATGFESDLFADLPIPDDEEPAKPETGPFQSRLLNELTSDEKGPPATQADVLLDEFSLPARSEGDARNAGNSR